MISRLLYTDAMKDTAGRHGSGATGTPGFLLTRHWRDTADGIELTYWFCTPAGPCQAVVSGTSAVCFIDRQQQAALPPDASRKPLGLRSLAGQPVDGLYFQSQKRLSSFREQHNQHGRYLLESDIKPADRYLMERFITASALISGDSRSQARHTRVGDAVLRAADHIPELRLLSVDIETNGFSGQLYSIGLHSADLCCVLMIGNEPASERDGYRLIYCDDERALLQQFIDMLAQHDPDALIGWNIVNFDLQHLQQRARHCAVPFLLGRDNQQAAILQPGTAGQPRVARIPGRVVLDGVDLLKAGFWQFESFSLESVAQHLLGSGKLITSASTDKVNEINRLFRDDKPALADYNFLDCRLVTEIFAKARLVEFAIQRSRLTGLALDRMGGSVAAFDHLYLPRLHRHGFVATDTNSGVSAGSPGGYVMDSQPGLYRNVLLLDFKSLYPSIIRTFRIDPMGLAQPGENPVPGFEGANFSRENHILPGIIESLWQERDQAKSEHNQPLSQAIKIIMNSFYGVLGASGCRFHQPRLTSSITLRGHEIIQQSQAFIEQRGYPVIYGDTDSVFVLLGENHSEKMCQEIGRQLTHDLNNWWRDTLQQVHHLTSFLEVEFETHFSRFLMPTIRGMSTGSKKRYAGLVNRGDESHLVIKGLEAVRTDWTPLARSFQRELLWRIFHDEPWESLVVDTAEALGHGRLDDQLVYHKRLRKPLESYVRNVPPHVQAARKIRKPGRWIHYVITENGPEPTGHLTAPINYQHYLDRQLAPAADTILHFLDTNFARVASPQLQMF